MPERTNSRRNSGESIYVKKQQKSDLKGARSQLRPSDKRLCDVNQRVGSWRSSKSAYISITDISVNTYFTSISCLLNYSKKKRYKICFRQIQIVAFDVVDLENPTLILLFGACSTYIIWLLILNFIAKLSFKLHCVRQKEAFKVVP